MRPLMTRLRDPNHAEDDEPSSLGDLCREASAEIERLTAERDEARRREREWHNASVQDRAESHRLTAENERLSNRNAALVESLRAHRCLVDGRATVGECQQCGCIDGLLISGDNQQQAVNSEEGK